MALHALQAKGYWSNALVSQRGYDAIGELSDVLRLTFKEVGATPDNAYWIWVSKDQNLIKQWAYFKHFSDSLPQFVSPWDDYEEYGEILLATGRGWRNLTEVAVLSSVPPQTFISL